MAPKYPNKLAEARDRAGMTQQQVADAIGMTLTGYQNYEYGKRDFRSSTLRLLSEVLGCSATYLLGLDDSKQIIKARPALESSLRLAPLLGRIAAGNPREAIAQADESVPLPPEFSNDDYDYFWLQPSGGSMNKHFTSDAWLLIRFTGEVQNGEIGAVMVNGDDATVKRVLYKNDGVHLVPESYDPEYREIFISKDDPSAPSFRPLGPVVYFRAKDGWRG